MSHRACEPQSVTKDDQTASISCRNIQQQHQVRQLPTTTPIPTTPTKAAANCIYLSNGLKLEVPGHEHERMGNIYQHSARVEHILFAVSVKLGEV